MKGHVDDHVHVLQIHVCIVPTVLTELFYPLQDGKAPLHYAAMRGHTACMEYLLSTPGIDVNIKNVVSWSTEYFNNIGTVADIASHYTFWLK